MKKVLTTLLTAGLILTVTGCNNVYDNKTLNTEINKTSTQVAETYVTNLYTWMELNSTEEDPYSFIYESLELETDISNISESERAVLRDEWKANYIVELTEKLDSDEDLLNNLILENTAFSMTRSTASRSASATEFGESYAKTLADLWDKEITFPDRSSSGSSSSGGSEEDDLTPIDGYFNNDKKHYVLDNLKAGRILINHGSEGSSWNIGHASLLMDDYVTCDTDSLKTKMYTITSFPYPGKVTWNNKKENEINGVQYEPLEYWCGTKGARKVKLYEVYTKAIKKDKNKASVQQGKDAVTYAENKLGCPYTYNFVANKNAEDTFYCSSLVRYAWKQAGVNMCPLTIGVSPSDLQASVYNKKYEEWTNY